MNASEISAIVTAVVALIGALTAWVKARNARATAAATAHALNRHLTYVTSSTEPEPPAGTPRPAS